MKIENIQILKKFAKEFAGKLKSPQAVALHGDLGAGKTELSRAIIQEFYGKDLTVPSPTFTIVQDYDDIAHFDLYRIKDISELEEIGFFDAIQTKITLIEWPEIADSFLPKNTIHIYLKSIGQDARELLVK